MTFLVGSHTRSGCDFFWTPTALTDVVSRKWNENNPLYPGGNWFMCGQLGERTVANLAAVNDLVWGLQWGGEVGFSHIYLSLELVLICSHIVSMARRAREGWITTSRCCSTSFGKQFMLANANQLQFVRVPIYDVCRQTLITSKDRDVSWSKNMKINH